MHRTNRKKCNDDARSECEKDTSEPLVIPKHNPPHIPPRHRTHIKSGGRLDDPIAPPVPPHRNLSHNGSSISSRNMRKKNTKVRESVKKQANHVNQDVPGSSQTFTKGTNDTWKRVTNNMNQNQLVEFFQNLKESNA